MSHQDKDCEICSHDWQDHDGVGDCRHADGRSVSGYCSAHQKTYAQSR